MGTPGERAAELAEASRAWWRQRRRGARLAMLGGLAASLSVAASLVVVVALLTSGGPAPEPVVAAAPTSEPTPTPAAPAPTPVPIAEPEEPEEPPEPEEPAGPPPITSLRELVSEVGYPADATYARLRIPAVGLDAPAGAGAVEPGRAMPETLGPAHPLWYDMSGFPGMGGAPGSGGNAIFGGHVDWNDRVPYAPDVRFRGPGAFFELRRVSPGDIIEVEYGGTTLRYRVLWREEFSASPDATDWGAIWRGTPGVDEITLYTCGGAYDPATRSYASRIVVRAVRV